MDTDAGGDDGAGEVDFCWWVESWWPKRGILDFDMVEMSQMVMKR